MRVPRYEPQVAPAAAPTVRLNADQYTTGVRTAGAAAQALGEAGGELGKVAVQMQEREDADLAFRAQTAYGEATRQFDADASATRGQSALDVMGKAKTTYAEAARKAGEILKTPRQQRIFGAWVGQQQSNSYDRLSRHVAEQRRVSVTDSTKSSIVVDADTAVDSNGDPTAVATARNNITKKMKVLADLTGAQATLEADTAEQLSLMHGRVIDRLADTDPERAKNYFSENYKEIRGDQRVAAEKTLRQSGLKTIAQTFADEVVGKASEAEAIKQARAKFSGEEESSAVLEVKTRYAEIDAARERDQRNAGDEAYRIYGRTGKVSDIPAGVLARMDGKTLLGLKKDAAGENAVTDWDEYSRLRDVAKTGKLTSDEVRKNFYRLAPSQRESLLDLVGKKPEHLKEVRSVDSQIGRSLVELDIEGEDAKIAEDIIRAEIDVRQTAAGKVLDQAQRQQVIDEMIMQGEVVNGRWYLPDPDRQYYQAVQKGEQDKFVPEGFDEIPLADREGITAQFKTMRGRAPTKSEILSIYNHGPNK